MGLNGVNRYHRSSLATLHALPCLRLAMIMMLLSVLG
jgi:hypothetical protein